MPADPIYQPKKWQEELAAMVAMNPLLAITSTKYSFNDYKELYYKLNSAYIAPGSADSYSGKKKLESVSLYQSIDALCEGEIEGLCDQEGHVMHLSSSNPVANEDGLRGIYLNDVAIKNTNSNSLNYNRVFADFKVGLPHQGVLQSHFKNPSLNFNNAWQTHNINASLSGIGWWSSYATSELKLSPTTALGTEPKALKANTSHQSFFTNVSAPIVESNTVVNILSVKRQQVVIVNHTVINNNVTSAQVSMTATLSSFNDNGDTLPSAVNFVIEMGYENDTVAIVDGGSVGYIFCGIHGIATSPYQRTYNIPLPPSVMKKNRFIKVWRYDGELSATNVKHQKTLTCSFISEAVDTQMTYPNTALMGMLFDARGFSQPPRRSYDVKMAKIRVPSNYNATARVYSGNWDGLFSAEKKWTDNPAWIFYDLATHKRYGIGKYGFRDSFVDKWNLYTISKYCDQLVPTGYSGLFPFNDFTISSDGTVVSIDDSTAQLKKDQYLSRYPEGSSVCLFETKDSASTDLDRAYRRVIYNPAYSNNTFSFTILAPIDVDTVFF